MNLFRKINLRVLIVLTGFLSLTALAGGIALAAGINAPPVEQLRDSIFSSFIIPGIALAVFVGCGSLIAMILLIRKNKFSILAATVSGIVIMFFEFVEVLIIGSPAGVAKTLQIFYFGLGTVITVFAISLWYLDLYFNPENE